MLRQWQQEVLRVAAEFARGDVRINTAQTATESRPLALLSRHRDVRDDD
jgi:hypothetical protein